MYRSSARLPVVLILAAVCDRGLLPSAAAASIVRTVATTERPVPGAPSDVEFRNFNAAYTSLNDAGNVAFLGYLTGSSVDGLNNEGIWSEGSGSLQLVARKGDFASGASDGARYFNFANTKLNNAGASAFWAGLIDNSFVENGNGIWSDRSGVLSPVAVDEHQAPGLPGGVNFTGVTLSALNDAGQIAFRGNVAGGGVDATNNEGVWSEGSGSLGLLARTGNPAPGTPSVENYDILGLPVLNNSGQTAFQAHTGLESGIWSGVTGSLAMVAHSGSQAAGTPSGVAYGQFSDPKLNDGGATAFGATLVGSGIGETNNEGIWTGALGGLQLVAREGSRAPDTPDGVNFGGEGAITFGEPAFNNANQTAFQAYVKGNGVDSTNNEGIWLGDADNLVLVAQTGNQAPGTASGVRFSSFFPWNGEHQLNDAGQSVFSALLGGSGVIPFENDLGIWAADRLGTLQLIVRRGDSLEVAPGDYRTVQDLFLNGVNERGQVAFWARFQGGEGIFVSNLVTVPEPGSSMVLTAGVLLLVLRRSRRIAGQCGPGEQKRFAGYPA